MSKVYSSSKPKSSKDSGIKSTKVEGHHGNGRVERIQHRAYEIYQQRLQNQMSGDMISDWVKAEQEVNSREMEGNQRDCQQDFCKIGN